MDLIFRMTKSQRQKIADWMVTHEQVYEGAIGGRYTYSFTPTSLGTVITITDSVTKAVLDVTDYEDW